MRMDMCMDGLFAGTACSQCAAGFYRFIATCHSCPSSGEVVNILIVVTLAVVWLGTNNYLCEEVESLDTFLSFAQMANIIVPTRRLICYYSSITNMSFAQMANIIVRTRCLHAAMRLVYPVAARVQSLRLRIERYDHEQIPPNCAVDRCVRSHTKPATASRLNPLADLGKP